ncbi:MAG: YlbF family regulator [Hominimerdicola sp.]
MNVIEMTRELGKAIQEDERYKRYHAACEANDKDTEIQNKIGEFNMKRMQLGQEMQKTDKDAEKMTALDNDVKALYDEIMAMPKMVEFNAAKDELDKLLGSVNYIISMSANGEDPMTCPEEQPHSCSGSCGSCGGCH